MVERVLAVGIDPAKRQHQAVGVLYPDRIVLELTFDNDVPDVEQLDARAGEVASHHGAEVVYGIEDHRGLGRRVVDVLQRRGREVRVVNPLSSNRQKQFYGEDKSDHVDARAIAAVVLRRRPHLRMRPTATRPSLRFARPSAPCRISPGNAQRRSRGCTSSSVRSTRRTITASSVS